MKKRMILLTVVLLMLTAALAGCMNNAERAARREKTDEISKLAEEYMTEKYSRLFFVKKCEYAVGERYEDDFFITFQDGSHAYYDTETETFYDDRQADTIVQEIYSNIWLKMLKKVGTYDHVNLDTQTFNLKYEYTNGLSVSRYSMFHELYEGDIQEYAGRKEAISVNADSVILITDDPMAYVNDNNIIADVVYNRFRAQRKGEGEMNVYIVTKEYHSSVAFDAEQVDVTQDGCLTKLSYGAENHIIHHHYMEVAENLYAMICAEDGADFTEGDITLVPVSDSDAQSEKIRNDMSSKTGGLLDEYVKKKRNLVMEQPIYKLQFSENVKHYESVDIAFMMKDSSQPLYTFEKTNERERGFFAYDMNGTAYNAKCLCSMNSRPDTVTLKADSEVYLWFGSQL